LVIDQSFEQLFLDVLAIHNVHLTPLYKGVKTRRMNKTQQQFESA